MTYNCINRCFEHHGWKLITFSITIHEQGTVHLWIPRLVDESKIKPPGHCRNSLKELYWLTALLFLQGSFQKNCLMSYIITNLSSFDQMKRNMQQKNDVNVFLYLIFGNTSALLNCSSTIQVSWVHYDPPGIKIIHTSVKLRRFFRIW